MSALANHPADRLAALRTEIARLKAEERTLRDGFADGRIVDRTGAKSQVEIRRTRRRVFVRERLPVCVLLDDRLWDHRPSVTVVTRAILPDGAEDGMVIDEEDLA